MVPGSFSNFILVYWTRPNLKYANYMVPSSFSRFILVHWTRPTLKCANYMVPGSFSRFILVFSIAINYYWSIIIKLCGTFLERFGKLDLCNLVQY